MTDEEVSIFNHTFKFNSKFIIILFKEKFGVFGDVNP